MRDAMRIVTQMLILRSCGSFGGWKSPRTSPAAAAAAAAAICTARTRKTQQQLLVSSATLSTIQWVQRKQQQLRQERQEARNQAIQQQVKRNFAIKQLITQDPSSLYALQVTVSPQLQRLSHPLSGKEKRGRVFCQQPLFDTLEGLMQHIGGHFSVLRKNSYCLEASYPKVNDNDDDDVDDDDAFPLLNNTWPIATDADVVNLFVQAQHFAQQHNLTRPTMKLCLVPNPHAPPPPPIPDYLQNLPNPATSDTWTMLSFYAFLPIPDPMELADQLRRLWKPFQVLGRVYVATEGVNAQMAVPTNVVSQFQQCSRTVLPNMENGINVDPIPLSRKDFDHAGHDGQAPFRQLHIRVRDKIVADGWDTAAAYNWQEAGYDMPPMEWHALLLKQQKLKQQQQQGDGSNTSGTTTTTTTAPIVLDCRNAYESDLGRFEGAEALGTQTFRDSWKVLHDRLLDTPKDTPILTYCTGGIRCVKVGAYLTQELGFTNVSRLAGGIIAYDRTLKEQAPDEVPMFKGTNFVFDGRLGRPITPDALGVCRTCGSETSFVTNCGNPNCHKRMVQCEDCRTSFHGTCSDACRQRLVNGNMQSFRMPFVGIENQAPAHAAGRTMRDNGVFKPTTLEDYALGYSSPIPPAYAEIEHNTRALIPSGSHMVSGSAQGRFLKHLASMTREGRVLELGTFTGYATTWMLEGCYEAGNVAGSRSAKGSRDSGPYVLTMERDAKAFGVAATHLKIVMAHGTGEVAAEKLRAVRAANEKVRSEAVTNDVSLSYRDTVLCEAVRVSDALAVIEELAAGKGDLLPAPFDMVFLDADKTRLYQYVHACLSSDKLLKHGGTIVVDNVLWKGLVLGAMKPSTNDFEPQVDSSLDDDDGRKNRRARKLANKMHRFNEAIAADPRAEVLIMTVRDGLSVIRKI